MTFDGLRLLFQNSINGHKKIRCQNINILIIRVSDLHIIIMQFTFKETNQVRTGG